MNELLVCIAEKIRKPGNNAERETLEKDSKCLPIRAIVPKRQGILVERKAIALVAWQYLVQAEFV